MSNIPQPANTMTGVSIGLAAMEVRGNLKRIVYLRFRRETYSDCHMMVKPWGAFTMGLQLIATALLAWVWIGKPRQ